MGDVTDEFSEAVQHVFGIGVAQVVSRNAIGDVNLVPHANRASSFFDSRVFLGCVGSRLAETVLSTNLGAHKMAEITFHGTTINTIGSLPAIGSEAPPLVLTGKDGGSISLADFAGQRLVLNIFPSIDTPTCATSVRTFNERAASLENATVLCVSADLPMAQNRFCGAEGIERVQTGSTFRNPQALDDYGVRIMDGPLEGLAARAVVVLDETVTVLHAELVGELADEPDYEAALSVLH